MMLRYFLSLLRIFFSLLERINEGGGWFRAKPLFIRSWLSDGVSRKGVDALHLQYNVTYFLDNPIDNRACLLTNHASNDLAKQSRVGKLPSNNLRKSNIA